MKAVWAICDVLPLRNLLLRRIEEARHELARCQAVVDAIQERHDSAPWWKRWLLNNPRENNWLQRGEDEDVLYFAKQRARALASLSDKVGTVSNAFGEHITLTNDEINLLR